MDELAILPNAGDSTHGALRASRYLVDSFAILDVVLELTDINTAVGIDLLTVPVADAINEVSGDLRAVTERIATIAGHRRFGVLAHVAIAELVLRNDLPMEVAVLELALEDALHVGQCAISVHLSVFEFASIVLTRLGGPLVVAHAVELSILELAFIEVPTWHG